VVSHKSQISSTNKFHIDDSLMINLSSYSLSIAALSFSDAFIWPDSIYPHLAPDLQSRRHSSPFPSGKPAAKTGELLEDVWIIQV
jgi:hypothetical protein